MKPHEIAFDDCTVDLNARNLFVDGRPGEQADSDASDVATTCRTSGHSPQIAMA